MVVFGTMTLAVEAGSDTVTATVMITPNPKVAVAIPLSIAQLHP